MKSILISMLCLVQADPLLLWPRPNSYHSGAQTVLVHADMNIEYPPSSTRLSRAVNRFRERVTKQRWSPIVPDFKGELDSTYIPKLSIKIDLNNTDEILTEKTDETYEIDLSTNSGEGKATINCKSIYGAIHGLESLIQMTQWDTKEEKQFLNKVPFNIKDGPKFSHRGLLLDTSRNFFPVNDIKRTIDGLSMSKMNVFHWHIVDAPSWPFKSEKYSQLWQNGTLLPRQVYSFHDIRSVVDYGLDRGVRVIPEIEAPAHSHAIGKAFPDLATCMDEDDWESNAAEPPSGQIDPTNEASIKIVNDIITEFTEVFPENYIHLSGDEVNLNCWNNSEKIQKYLKDNQVDIESLLPAFAKEMHNHATNLDKKIMVYQEILLNHNISLPKDSLVQVWIKPEDTKKVIERGYNVIASSADYWYLDCGRGPWIGNAPGGKSWCDPFKSWQRIYNYNLLANLTNEQSKMVKGGEVALWSEQVDAYNLDVVAWPRTASAGEVLWSGNLDDNGNLLSTKPILPHLNNFRFYLAENGLRPEALQPLWCVMNPGRCDLADPKPKN